MIFQVPEGGWGSGGFNQPSTGQEKVDPDADPMTYHLWGDGPRTAGGEARKG